MATVNYNNQAHNHHVDNSDNDDYDDNNKDKTNDRCRKGSFAVVAAFSGSKNLVWRTSQQTRKKHPII
jgi:hypothetical protein